MPQANTEPKLLLPALQPLYDAVIPLSWLIIRVAVGWNLLVHGWGKIMSDRRTHFSKRSPISASRRRRSGSGVRF